MLSSLMTALKVNGSNLMPLFEPLMSISDQVIWYPNKII
jgi:hypothetical protein